jgi:hypothetical protein
MPVLPKPYPDEVVGSVVARACQHTGLPIKRLLRSIYGSQRSTASFLLGENFGPLAYRAGLEPRELLLQHTMFPYAVAFMAPTVQAQLEAKALAARPGEDSLASLTKNISHGVPFRRVCKQCIQDDLALYGEAYWHRIHLLPGVTICRLHGSPLFETGIEVRGRAHTGVTLLPHKIGDLRQTVSLPSKLASTITVISAAALKGELPMVANRLNCFRTKAVSLGYVLPSGDIAGAVLARVLQKSFGEKYLAWVGCPINDEVRNTWPALMVRSGGTSNFAAPKHVLLQALLDLEVGPPEDMTSIYRAPGKQTRDYRRLDYGTLEKLRRSVNLVAKAGERVTVEKLLRDAGVWSAFKHHRELFPKTVEYLQEFKQSDQSERQLGGRAYWRKRLPGRYGRTGAEVVAPTPK